ncbi:MAG: hypothetical protein GVY02_08060, partial [Bacteroidetes bacterium]|nr:hypothetical protein [Bacteroidota bacterium]
RDIIFADLLYKYGIDLLELFRVEAVIGRIYDFYGLILLWLAGNKDE